MTKSIAICLVLIASSMPAMAAPKKVRASAPEDPMREKCIPLVQAQVCLPKAPTGWNCAETFDAELADCIKKKGQYP